MDKWLILMVIAATLGGAIVGILGWAKQKPPVPFDGRAFLVSLGSSLLAGAVYAVTLATRTQLRFWTMLMWVLTFLLQQQRG